MPPGTLLLPAVGYSVLLSLGLWLSGWGARGKVTAALPCARPADADTTPPDRGAGRRGGRRGASRDGEQGEEGAGEQGAEGGRRGGGGATTSLPAAPTMGLNVLGKDWVERHKVGGGEGVMGGGYSCGGPWAGEASLVVVTVLVQGHVVCINAGGTLC